jgi:hypothetical protein
LAPQLSDCSEGEMPEERSDDQPAQQPYATS